MARPFNVTTAAESVRLDAQGRGATTYTASNVSGRARRGRARLVPGDPAQGSWLAVEGEAEREFTPDGTQQYVVKIAVPPGTPAGKFTFGLDVVSVENPDEEFTQGPKVAFEVAPPPAKKPFPWWIVAVVVALLVVGGLVAWLMSRRGEAPPETAPVPATPVVETSAAPAAPSDGCQPGLVWRGASGSDRVCVTPDRRAEVLKENELAPSRYQPGGGAYGASTCLPGYVWREAYEGDAVCVTPESRTLAKQERAAAGG